MGTGTICKRSTLGCLDSLIPGDERPDGLIVDKLRKRPAVRTGVARPDGARPGGTRPGDASPRLIEDELRKRPAVRPGARPTGTIPDSTRLPTGPTFFQKKIPELSDKAKKELTGEIKAAVEEFNKFDDIKGYPDGGLLIDLDDFQFQKNGVNAALNSYVSASNQIQKDVQTDEYKEIYATLTSGKVPSYEKFKQERVRKKNGGSIEYGDVGAYLRYTRTSLMQSHIIEKAQEEKKTGKRTELYRLQGAYEGWEEEYTENSKITIDRFWSTSEGDFLEHGKTKIEEDAFNEISKVRIHINVKDKACGAKLNNNEDQREVLIPPGTQFEVKSKEYNKDDKKYDVHLVCLEKSKT